MLFEAASQDFLSFYSCSPFLHFLHSFLFPTTSPSLGLLRMSVSQGPGQSQILSKFPNSSKLLPHLWDPFLTQVSLSFLLLQSPPCTSKPQAQSSVSFQSPPPPHPSFTGSPAFKYPSSGWWWGGLIAQLRRTTQGSLTWWS